MLNCLHATLHSRDCVALTAKSNTAAHNRTELAKCHICSTATVHTGKVATKDKDLIGLQLRDIVRRKVGTLNSVVRSHVTLFYNH